MAGRQSFLSGGTFCEVFCEAVNVEFSSIDYEEPLRSLLNLQISGNRGCQKCHLLYEVCVGLHPLLEKNAAVTLVGLTEFDGSVQLQFHNAGNPSANNERIWDPVDIDVYLNYLCDTKTPDWIALTPRKQPLTCRQDQFQEVLIDWLDGCENNHGDCLKSNGQLPTRVIHVGDDKGTDPFLYVSQGEECRYVALSHCWGEVLLIKTEKKNLSKHRHGIPYDTLPKVFRDAITVARAINVEYIWIDSLCIVQDDGPDWEIESSKMASIYQNAHVVLIASNSADSKGGFWNASWDEYGQRDGAKEFLFTNRDGSISQIIARKTVTHEDTIPEAYLEYESPSPLSKRAWTLQEELLASRCIYFTGKELLWKCQSATKCECMEEDAEDAKKTEVDRKKLWEGASSEDAALRFGEWRSLMAYYSKRNITYESDRLPAISGLAKYMKSKGAGDYLAGMWKEDLWESLLWLPALVWSGVQNDNLTSTYRRRASVYRAPTWSWISLETYGDGRDKPKCPGIVDWQEGRSWYLERNHAKIIDTHCEASGVDPTGAIKSGYIILQSRCIETWVKWESRTSQILFGKVPLSVHWDIDLEVGLRQKVYCLLIGDTITYEDNRAKRPIKALVLKRSRAVAGTFERVGLCAEDNFQGTRFDLFGQAKEMVVTII